MRSLLLMLPGLLAAQAPPSTPSPPAGEEALSYSINWPSGLGLGEARLESKRTGDRWEFQFSIEAAVPGMSVRDRFRSISTTECCSLEFEKDFTNGRRKGHERTSFDSQASVGTRVTLDGGGKSEFPAPPCPRDALGFLFHLRNELSQGRLPPSQVVYFGAPYQVRVEYGGARSLRIGEEVLQADRLTTSVKGPASEVTFEIFFARDAARTPILVRAPFSVGTFSMELVR